MKVTYNDAFYAEMEETNLASARAIVPLIMTLIRPHSVIDVGCGRGLWLQAFRESGVIDIFGVDGPWVKPEDLAIPQDDFETRDLQSAFTIGRTADLVMSLEVAEHVPASSADHFVAILTSAAPVVLFSAAIPFQGGVNHVNEQWPDYWEEKFRAHGYVTVDAIRRKVWSDSKVSSFYAQNTFLYVKESALTDYPALLEERRLGYDKTTRLVHPDLYLYVGENSERWKTIVPYMRFLPLSLVKGIKKLLTLGKRGSIHQA